MKINHASNSQRYFYLCINIGTIVSIKSVVHEDKADIKVAENTEIAKIVSTVTAFILYNDCMMYTYARLCIRH